MRVTHLALDLGPRHERGDGVDDDDVDGVGADQHLRDLESLLTRVRLRDEEVVHIHIQLSGVADVEGVLRVDECGDTALLLGVRDHLQTDRRLPGRFRSIDFRDPTPGHAADADRGVEVDRAGRDRRDLRAGTVDAHSHDRALSVRAFDLLQRRVQVLFLLRVLFRHVGLVSGRSWPKIAYPNKKRKYASVGPPRARRTKLGDAPGRWNAPMGTMLRNRTRIGHFTLPSPLSTLLGMSNSSQKTRARIRFAGTDRTPTPDGRETIAVRLEWDGVLHEGEASGVQTREGDVRTASLATLAATRAVLDGAGPSFDLTAPGPPSTSSA